MIDLPQRATTVQGQPAMDREGIAHLLTHRLGQSGSRPPEPASPASPASEAPALPAPGAAPHQGTGPTSTPIFDAMSSGGDRLEALLEEEGVEDVTVDGVRATVEYVDRPRRVVEGAFDSPEHLIAWVNHMAHLSGHGERPLTPATPVVSFRLPDGSRATASLLTTRPSLAVRKHRIRDHGIGELIQWGTLNNVLAHFLVSCVTARLNLLIVGETGAGKTSLLRALAREVPPGERLVTLEPDRELYLDEPGSTPGPAAFSFEIPRTRAGHPGDGGPADDIVATALRYNASRLIVGEVRGPETVALFQAMSAGGSGSMCTLHVRRPDATVPRLVQLCAGAGLADATAQRLVAASVDAVIHLAYVDETALGGRRHRFVSHVHEVHDAVGGEGRVLTTEVFAPVPGEPRGVFQQLPGFIDDLERHGFKRQWLTHQPHTHWGPPLTTARTQP